MSYWGATVERRGREDRGTVVAAAGHRIDAVREGVSRKFLTSEWKMLRFDAFWVLFLQTDFLQIVP